MNPNLVLEISLADTVTFANQAAEEVVKSLTPAAQLGDNNFRCGLQENGACP
jgi:hypothetical protein